MALDTLKQDKIRMPNGETITRSSIVESSINYYKEAYMENLTDICDFSDGSEIRTLHESWAIELFAKYRHAEKKAKMKYVQYASGTYLDMLACEFHLTRKPSETAKGTVTFTTNANINGEMLIPQGTIILSRKTGHEYILQEDIHITSPNTPVNGTVYSKLTGAEYNASEDTLTAFQNIEVNRTEVQVTNPTPIIDGRDAETDEELRERILKVKQERAYGTAPQYSNLIIENVSDVHDVQFVDSIELTTDEKYPRHYKKGTTQNDLYQRNSDWSIHYDSDGNPVPRTFAQLKQYLCTDCTAVIFVNAVSKPTPDHTLQEVDELMTQQNNLVVGQKFHIEPAQLTKLYFSMELYVTAVIDEELIREQLELFFSGGDAETINGVTHYPGLYIGESLTKSRLLDVIEDIPGIHQVGYLRLIKYSTDIPTDITEWNNNGDSGYTYVDDEGYTFWRRNSTSPIPVWGSKNWTTLETEKGCVFALGQKKDLDSTVKTVFTITMKKVNEQGELI